jgi:peroxiredoxin/outer membrane lipoprotein-sorting protein
MNLALFLIAATATAQDFTANEILAKADLAYSRVKSIRVAAQREDTFIQRGVSGSASSDCELASVGRQRYFARMKRDGQDAIAISDGETTWRALASKKQWSQISAASSGADDEQESADSASRDLHSFVLATVFGQFASIVRSSENPVIEKSEDIKISGTKIPAYVIRTRAGDAMYQLWIDKQRFMVLQSKRAFTLNGVNGETKIKMTALEVNQEIPETRFRFEPTKGWAEVDMLVLPGEERMVLTGSRAANFSLKTLDGESVALDQTRGKVVVLDFWATWCPPCRKELPSIEKLRAEFGERVQFYGINDEDSSTVKGFIKKNGYEMAVLMDGKRQVHRQYGVSSIPTLLVIDKQGVIRQHFIGSRDEATLRKAVQSALASN